MPVSGNKVHDKKGRLCGSKKKSGGKCGRPAGWGTSHPGSGRCKLHGGSSTGPNSEEGKKKIAANALKHGGYSEKLLNYEEREIYNFLYDETIIKYKLDKENPMYMATLHRACMAFLKTLRMDEWEMEEEWVPHSMLTNKKGKVLNDHQGQPMLTPRPVFDHDGIKIRDEYGKLKRLRWAKGAPNWEQHFQKYMIMLGTDRSGEIKAGTDAKVAKAAEEFAWLWGQKSKEEAVR